MAAVGKSSGIGVREGRAADLAAVTRLAAELGYPAEETQIKARLDHLTGSRDQRLFVADDSGTVVGWVHVHFGRWLVVAPRGEVMGLIVSSAGRGRGVGRLLMHAAETWTRQQGGTSLALRSNIVRKDAHGFYARLGYKVTKTSLNFAKTL